jgi:hypothetical protein
MTAARDLVKARGGDWCGTYGLVPGPGHSGRDRSLKIWEDGDRVLVHSFAGDDWRDCRAFLGIDDDQDRPMARRHRPTRRDCRPADRFAEARKIWEETRPALHTDAQRYLLARGITIPPPPCIRYYEGMNALVAGLQRQDGSFGGIQRIFLSEAEGTVRYTAKRSLGPIKGGAVRLTPVAGTIQLCESIEDGLALLQMTGRPTWAVPGVSFMATFELPREVHEVILAPDHDKAGLEAIEKARSYSHVTFRQLLPPEGRDWCDLLDDWGERQAIQQDPGSGPSWIEEFCNGV